VGLALTMVMTMGAFTAAQDGGWEAFEASLADKYAGKTLRVITINDPFQPAMEEVNKLFTELTGAEVVVDGFGYDAVFEKEQLACQQESDTYDVIVLDVPWTQAFDNCTEHLNARVEAGDPEVVAYGDYFEVMREGVEWNDEIIGLPFAPYFVLQHYNTEYFDTLGLEPATNYDEMLANAEAANLSEALPNVNGTILNNQAGSAVGQAFFEYIYNIEGGKPFESMYPGTPDAYADMTPLFSSPQGIEVVEFFKAMLPHQPDGALNMAWSERQNFFNTGLIAFNSQWNVTTPSADDPETSSIVGNVGTAPFPHDSADLVTQVGGWSMGLNKHAVDPDFAWDYMQWFTSPQINVEFAKLGGFPARESTLANPELNEQYAWYSTLKEVIPTAFADCRPRNNESFNIINTLGTFISRAMSGEMTTEDAMKAADLEIGTMLQEAGYTVNLP
jgi:multiple sugar transport system substrate-binding protein